MNKGVGANYGLKHSFIINHWASPDILPLCVTPLGMTGGTPGGSGRGIPPGCFLTYPCFTSQAGTWQDQHAWTSADGNSQVVCFPVRHPIPRLLLSLSHAFHPQAN